MGRRAAMGGTWLMALILAGAGCGGGAGAGGTATPVPAKATPIATAATAPTEAATDPSGAETAEPGQGSTTDVCALPTVDEIRAASGIATRAVPSTTPQFDGAAGDGE